MARGAKPTCLCGECKKCVRRTYYREWRQNRGKRELTEAEREAARERSRRWYWENRERARKAAAERAQANPGMSSPRVKAWREQNRERDNAWQLEYYHRNKANGRHAAREKVHQAILSGALVRQPCEVCGVEPAHAHHDDYGKPLDVRWLCVPHHAQHHARERREAA